jgi:hypothetical protein
VFSNSARGSAEIARRKKEAGDRERTRKLEDANAERVRRAAEAAAVAFAAEWSTATNLSDVDVLPKLNFGDASGHVSFTTSGLATVSFVVRTDGTVRTLRIDETTDEAFLRSSLAIVRGRRYSPGMKQAWPLPSV